MLAPHSEHDSWPPNYANVFVWRQQQVFKFRKQPVLLLGAKEYYRSRPAEFICHWVDTYDPRNASSSGDAQSYIPFILFKRQKELIDFFLACLNGETGGLVEKCRDLGATWACCAFAVWLWLFWPGVSVGFGSRKELLVDRIGDPDSIFEKMRLIINRLPVEFLPAGFIAKEHMTYMRIVNTENGATITGEAGDNIGRGGRKRVVFKDESAHYEHPELIEASLTDNTRVQIDVSSVFGTGTVFHRKREAGIDWSPGQPAVKGKTNVFVMDWRDHPAKTQAWYDERKAKAVDDGLLHIFAQEVDRNYSASVDGIIIPAEWVRSAIDAHLKLDFDDSGGWCAALDVADEGGDTNALAKRKGCILKSVDEWGARDTGVTTRKAVDACNNLGHVELQYDCIGIGSGVKAEANRLADEGLLPKSVVLVPWSAADEVLNPKGNVIPGDKSSPLNVDFYENLKAQAWWQLRRRFEITHRAILSLDKSAPVEVRRFTWKKDDLISIPSTLPLLRKIEKELSQAVNVKSKRLKLMVDKQPEGMKSPNIADAIVMAFWPARPPRMIIPPEILAKARMRTGTRAYAR